MSGEQNSSDDGRSRVISNMPLPGAKVAPHFNGVAPTDFLKQIEILAKTAAITDENDKVDFIYSYSSDRVKSKLQDIT
ncbi:hypothetical protein V5O48_019548 [Marasmius crinis-equi]|uniref:Uncharacterized protein n=1 Tax=Marasmius crinis-equi TaxID=585013 RepID=A0ABR3EI38_9AGAR